MTPPSWVFLAPGIIPSPGHYPAVWGDCGLSQCRSLQTQGPKEGLVFPGRFQDSLIVPKQAILPLVFKTLRRALSPRTTGRSRKSGDPGLRSGTWTVILWSRLHWCSRQSWKAARGRGWDHSLPLPRRYFLGGVEARGQEQRENPRPLLQCVLHRGWWSLGAHQDQATVIHSPRTAESLGRPLKSSAVSFVRRLVGLGVWFSLRVREVPGSNPGRARPFGFAEARQNALKWFSLGRALRLGWKGIRVNWALQSVQAALLFWVDTRVSGRGSQCTVLSVPGRGKAPPNLGKHSLSAPPHTAWCHPSTARAWLRFNWCPSTCSSGWQVVKWVGTYSVMPGRDQGLSEFRSLQPWRSVSQ